VGTADDEVQIEGPVLTELETTESVEDQGFPGDRGAEFLVDEQAVAPEPFHESEDGGMGNPVLLGDLTQSRTGENAQEDGAQEFGSAQPVAGGEGL
jgi:hypothetical protein